MTSTRAFALLPQPVTGRAPAAFQAHAKALCQFWMDNRRWPSAVATSDSERKLASWHNQQRKYLRTGISGPVAVERVAYLDAVAPGWRGATGLSRETAFEDCAQRLVYFRMNNPNRWPSTVGADGFERELGEWLHNQRQYFRTGSNPAFTAERAAYLDAVAPGWSDSLRPRGEDAFRARAQTVATFRWDNGRWPSTVATDKSERALGDWLHSQRRYFRTGSNPAFTAERANYLDQFLPGWRQR